MSSINPKVAFKNLNKIRKEEKKKRKEQKLLKAAVEYVKDSKEVEKQRDDFEDNGDGKVTPSRFPLYTVSIAVPGSILDNAQTLELRTYLAGQVARAACIYRIDEVIVFDDGSTQQDGVHRPSENSCIQFAKLLQYLECPQYLRKYLFPMHNDLRYAGLLNPLDAPHHLRQSDVFPYREGVVSNQPVKKGKGSLVNVGLLKNVCVDKILTPGVRVTVKLLSQKEETKKMYGSVVPPSQPRTELGVYWGYDVRITKSFSDIFTKSPYKEGYDFTIGTSDKGSPIQESDDSQFTNFKHMLVVFGGLDGLESALECDESLTVSDVSLLFDKYLNTCPSQGSRTIRTEEAILISLAQITTKISKLHR
ncbi:putative methyltransferase C9orf114 homolog [Homalodisca vitripennis]|uniref:putative methyltransferase C9orf114 homolog n=1 Tax=Homalodisca vitripennis TaxID=197043 RepID=UPI001EEAD8C1|nr:putative methyltransferase C9orf114 homolog [Homalodisca vitripennis]